MSFDSQNILKKVSSKTSILPQAGAGALTGTSADCQGYDAVMFSVKIGALGNADNTGTFTPEESVDDSVWTTIAAGDLDAALPAINDANKNAAYMRAYLGKKRFVRVNRSAIAGTAAAANVEVDILRSVASREPVTQG